MDMVLLGFSEGELNQKTKATFKRLFNLKSLSKKIKYFLIVKSKYLFISFVRNQINYFLG